MPLQLGAHQIRSLSWPRKSFPFQSLAFPFLRHSTQSLSGAVPSVHGLSAADLCIAKLFPLRGCSFPKRGVTILFLCVSQLSISYPELFVAKHFPCAAKPLYSDAVLLSAYPVQGSSCAGLFCSFPKRFGAKRGHANPVHCTTKQFLFGGKHRFSNAVRFQSLQILRDARRAVPVHFFSFSTQGISGANRFLSAPERCGDPRCTAAAAPCCSSPVHGQGRGCTSM